MRILFLFLVAQLVSAQAVPPRPKLEEYPVHAQATKAGIGAEFMVHVVAAAGQSFFVPDFFTVEVAIYPAKETVLPLNISHFTLRINGKKQELQAQAAEFVAASLKYPDWSQRPSMTASAGVGDGGVTMGGPRTQPRFPGDDRPPRQSGPVQPTLGAEKEKTMTADEGVVAAALMEGQGTQPVAGYLYFPYRGDGRKAKKVELLYRGPGGEVTLLLR